MNEYESPESTVEGENGAGLDSRLSTLSASKLTLRYGNRAVLDVPTFEVRQGEVMAIMGPNGAGKSSLLLCLALLQRPSSGEVRVLGQTVRWRGDLLALRRRMAVVFQEPLLLDTTVDDNVTVGPRLRGHGRRQANQAANQWLGRFGIAHLARQQARNLSGGEAQRASLARAFALQPEILLLDEPFAALDPLTRAAVVADLRDILHETGVTTLVITHDRDEALALGDRVGVLIGGHLRQIGPVERVFSRPSDAEVASFVGIETVANGRVIAQEDGIAQVEAGGSAIEVVSDVPVGSQVLVCLRPEDVTLLQSSAEDHGPSGLSSARNRLRGTIERLAPLGAQTRVYVDCGGFSFVALITRRSASALCLAIGQPVSISFKASAVHLIRR